MGLVDDKSRIESMISTENFSLVGHNVVLEIGKSGFKVPILERLEDKDHYIGPDEFNVVVNFGRLFMDFGMRGTMVSEEQMWSSENLPPDGVKILEFSSPKVGRAVRAISEIASNDSDKDLSACNAYLELNKQV